MSAPALFVVPGFCSVRHESWRAARRDIAPSAWTPSLRVVDLDWWVAETARHAAGLPDAQPLPPLSVLAAVWGLASKGSLSKVMQRWRDALPAGHPLSGADTAERTEGERSENAQRTDGERTTGDQRHESAPERTEGERSENAQRTDGEPQRDALSLCPARARADSPRAFNQYQVQYQDPPDIQAPTPAGSDMSDGPEERSATENLPAWVPRAQDVAPLSRAAAAAEVARAIQEVQQGRFLPLHRLGTSAGELLALWRALGRPPLSQFAAEVALVAAWAREAPDPLAARDLRAEGWPEGRDRSRSVATLCVRKRWEERFSAAQHWSAAGRPQSSATPPPSGRPAHRADKASNTLDQLARIRARAQRSKEMLDDDQLDDYIDGDGQPVGGGERPGDPRGRGGAARAAS